MSRYRSSWTATCAQAIRAGDLSDFQPYTNEERDAAVVFMNKHNAENKDHQVDVNNQDHVEAFVKDWVRQ